MPRKQSKEGPEVADGSVGKSGNSGGNGGGRGAVEEVRRAAPRPAQGSVTVFIPEVLLSVLEERVRRHERGMKGYFSLMLRAYRAGGPDARALTDLVAASGNNRYQKSDLKLKRKSFTALDEDWGKLKALSARGNISCSFLYVILFMFEAGLVTVRRDRVLVKSPEAREVLENIYPDIRTIALIQSK